MKFSALMFALLCLTSCAVSTTAIAPRLEIRPDIVATNAFYYYRDVDKAWAFYRDTLGFETVVDYGFAKIVRLAESSYLTLVQASEGMHTAEEPKTVTLSLVTDELSHWGDYLVSRSVPMRVAYPRSGEKAKNSFVAVDPEGYLLKFVRFNPHPGHESFVAAFAETTPVVADVRFEDAQLSIRSTAFSAYFDDLEAIKPFYEGLFDVSPTGQLDGVDAYQLSGSGFLLLVEGSDGLHHPTKQAGVTYSFLTTDINGWYQRANNWPGFELRTPEVLDEDGKVYVFVGYDPDGIFLEWDTFQNVAENEALLRRLP